MARNNEFNGSNFFRQVEDDYKKYYINGISETDFGFEHTDQNYPPEGSGESSDDQVKGQLGFDQPTSRAQLIDNIDPQSSEDVFSLSSVQSQFSEHSLSLSKSSDPRSNTNIPPRATDLLLSISICTEENKGKIAKLASEAMDELKRMAMATGEPLWRLDLDKKIETLNYIEYIMEFASINFTIGEIMRMVEVRPFRHLAGDPKSNNGYSLIVEDIDEFSHEGLGLHNQSPDCDHDQLHSEGSRYVVYVEMKPGKLVELLMDLSQWSVVFSKIVSRVSILGVLASTGTWEQNYDGTLQVMGTEFYAPTPFIPTRETYFARYCKRLSHGMWGVVDVSLESLFQFPFAKTFRRRPSGCLIQEMPDGGSKVIWIEHVQVYDKQVHNIFQPLLSSGFAFSANRWAAILAHHCALMALSPPTADGVLNIPEAGTKSLLALSRRMMSSFCDEISASATNKWRGIPISRVDSGEKMLMMTKTNNDDPGKPTTPTVVFATSLELPATPKQVFDFLSNVESRSKWDVLSQSHSIKEVARINTGGDPGNHLSVIQVNSALDKIAILYLQQNYKDSTGAYVVFAPLDILAMSRLLNGGNPEFVKILPSGFVVLPDVSKMHGGIAHGSLLTVAFHIVDDVTTSGEHITSASADVMHEMITEALTSIKKAVVSGYN